MTLKELRKSNGLTQRECAQLVGIPLRTYIRYEQDPALVGSIKYRYMTETLQKRGIVDETNGILSLQTIQTVCENVLPKFDVEYCYLFGSYAKGTATSLSDVDLFVSTSTTGIRFFELVERLKTDLKKNVDVINQKQLENNPVLTGEILKDGIKIYK